MIGAHLDAAEAASHMLDALFALRGRVRPWSKYPRWELELEPLGAGAAWRADVFLERLERLLQEPSPGHQQQLFRDVEELVRAAGHASVMDSWGPSLPLLRGTIEANDLGGEALGEKPRAIERRELLVATDGIAVDHHERHRPLPAQIPDALTECRVVVERHLLEVEVARLEQRLGADAETTPLRRIEDDSGHQEA